MQQTKGGDRSSENLIRKKDGDKSIINTIETVIIQMDANGTYNLEQVINKSN